MRQGLINRLSPGGVNQVVLLLGQSNAEGTGTYATNLSGDYEDFGDRCTAVRIAQQLRCNDDDGAEACDYEWDPVHVEPRLAAFGEFGPELGIARAIPNIIARAPGQTYIIKCATGGTDLFNNWEPGRTQGPVLYSRAIAFIERIMAPLGRYEVPLCCWVQGEADAGVEAKALAYEDNLNSLVSNLRSDLSSPEMVFAALRLHADYSFGSYAGQVRSAFNAAAAADDRLVLATADDLSLSGDGIHYGANEICEIGLRLGAAGDALIIG